VVQQPRPITFIAAVRFPAPAIAPTQMTSDLRGMFDRTTQIANPRGITVGMDGAVVVLRGAVKDEDEARTAEGMVRLTPGVREVRNELTYPKP
jgi:osmotically-inducible protein OsmY